MIIIYIYVILLSCYFFKIAINCYTINFDEHNFVGTINETMRLSYNNLFFKVFLTFYLKESKLFNKENYKILKIM